MINGKYKLIFAHCKQTFTFWGIISTASWHCTEWILKDLAIFYSSHCCAMFSNVQLFATPWTVASSVHGDFPGKNAGVGCHTLLRGSFEPRSPVLEADSLPSKPTGKPKHTGVCSLSLLQWIFPTQESNCVSCIAGTFFTSWATKEAVLLLQLQKSVR